MEERKFVAGRSFMGLVAAAVAGRVPQRGGQQPELGKLVAEKADGAGERPGDEGARAAPASESDRGGEPARESAGLTSSPEKQKQEITFPLAWRVLTRLPERKGQPCRMAVRARTMNSCLVEFPDGFRVVTSRNYVRRR